jgi:hypothetical protein
MESMWLPGNRLLPAAIVIHGDWSRFKALLFENRAVVPARANYTWPSTTIRYTMWVAQAAFLVPFVQNNTRMATGWLQQRPRSNIEAIYAVEEFSQNRNPLPDSDAVYRWRLLGIHDCSVTALTVDDRSLDMNIAAAATETSFPCSTRDTTRLFHPDTLRYVLHDKGLVLAGRLGNDSLRVLLRRIPDDSLMYDPRWYWTKVR